MSHNKGLHFLDVYWAFNEKPHLFKDGLHLKGKGAGILGTSVSIAIQVNFWTKRSHHSLSGNREGIPPPTRTP